MDAAAQIKNDLISRIQSSKDLNFLRALQALFSTSEPSLFELSQAQQNSITISRSEIKSGEYLENSHVIPEMKAWLAKK